MPIEVWVNETLYPGWDQHFRMKRELARLRSDFQEILVFESYGHGRVMLLDGIVQITEADEFSATVFLADGQSAALTLESMRWAAAYIDESRRHAAPRRVDAVIKRGDVVRLARGAEGEWELAQIPKAQGALVSLSPEDGALVALAGGFSFGLNKFNRATQSLRQPGSSFKPFVYAAAFERGFTPASIVLDAQRLKLVCANW